MSSILEPLHSINATDPDALTHLLDLPDVAVLGLERAPWLGGLLVQAVVRPAPAPGPRCSHLAAAPHQTYTRWVRDVPWAGWPAVLHLQARRLWCAPCRRPFTPPLAAIAPYARTTRRYAAALIAAVTTSTVQQVADQERHGYKAVEGIFYRAAATAHPSGPPAGVVRRLGIDEIAARKGHGQFRLVLVDLDSHAVVEQLPDRTQETLRTYLQQWTPEQRAAVVEVAVDFWAAYHRVAAELLPQARVVGDRFHVQKHLNDAVNTTRRTVQRQLPAADREFVGEWRGVLLRNEEDLGAEEWIALAAIKSSIAELERVHTLKEEWRAIFNAPLARPVAAEQVSAWLAAAWRSGVAALEDFADFVDRWREPILNYFVARTTSGIVEGLNNKIKLIKRQAFGFGNDGHFRLRVLMACRGAR